MTLEGSPIVKTEKKPKLDLTTLSDDDLEALIDPERIPRHIAIIMDGNGRWAQEHGMSRIEGHRAAVQSVWDAVDECGRLHVEALTLYAFSTENWRRPKSEVHALMRLFREQLKKQTPSLKRHNVTLRAIGELHRLPLAVRWQLNRSMRALSGNNGLALNLALSYGGRQEIASAIQRIAEDAKAGRLNVDDITEERVARYLYTDPLPDPDLMIRTSGEVRLSNFLLWQSAYAEFHFTPVYWPDFRRRHLYEAVLIYQQRDRRYGAVNSG